MSQSFDLASLTNVNFNGADCAKVMLNGVRIWERYTATRQVWVASGYNQTTFQHIATTYASRFAHQNTGSWYWNSDKERLGFYVNPTPELLGFSWYGTNMGSYKYQTHWVGTRRYTRGRYRHQSRSGTSHHDVVIYDNVTTYVDTSSYQSQNYTAYYA